MRARLTGGLSGNPAIEKGALTIHGRSYQFTGGLFTIGRFIGGQFTTGQFTGEKFITEQRVRIDFDKAAIQAIRVRTCLRACACVRALACLHASVCFIVKNITQQRILALPVVTCLGFLNSR